MPADMIVYVCASADKAEEAKDFLKKDYPNVTVESVDGVFTYDSVTYLGGSRHEDALVGKLIVIGRR